METMARPVTPRSRRPYVSRRATKVQRDALARMADRWTLRTQEGTDKLARALWPMPGNPERQPITVSWATFFRLKEAGWIVLESTNRLTRTYRLTEAGQLEATRGD